MNLSKYPFLHASFYWAKNVAYCGFPFEVSVKVDDTFVRTHDDFTIWSEERCRYLESESIHSSAVYRTTSLHAKCKNNHRLFKEGVCRMNNNHCMTISPVPSGKLYWLLQNQLWVVRHFSQVWEMPRAGDVAVVPED